MSVPGENRVDWSSVGRGSPSDGNAGSDCASQTGSSSSFHTACDVNTLADSEGFTAGQIRNLEQTMRPGPFCSSGFLGPQEDLEIVWQEDQKTLFRMGVSIIEIVNALIFYKTFADVGSVLNPMHIESNAVYTFRGKNYDNALLVPQPPECKEPVQIQHWFFEPGPTTLDPSRFLELFVDCFPSEQANELGKRLKGGQIVASRDGIVCADGSIYRKNPKYSLKDEDEGFSVATMNWGGSQGCPFGKFRKSIEEMGHPCCPSGYRDYRITNARGEYLDVSMLGIGMIARHGFFQGPGSPYRIDPKRVCQVLNLGPYSKSAEID